MGIEYRASLWRWGSQPDRLAPRYRPRTRQHLHAGPDVDDAVLAVGGKDEVVRSQRPGAADLGRLLAQAGRPDAELALALEVVALDVDAPHHHQLAVQVAEVLVGQVDLVGVVLEERPVLAEQPNLLVGLVHASVSRVVAPTSRSYSSGGVNTQAPGTGERRSGGFNTQGPEPVAGSGPCGCRPGGGGASGSPGDRSRSVATGDDSVNVLRCSQTEHQGNYGDGDTGSCRTDYLNPVPIWPELTTLAPDGATRCGLSKPPEGGTP